MEKSKKKRLEAKGWKVGTVDEFLASVKDEENQVIIGKGPLPDLSIKDFDDILAKLRHQARKAGLKRGDITEAIQNVRSVERISLQKAGNKVDDAGNLEKRAASGTRRGFERAMKKVRDAKPSRNDEP